MSFKSLESWFSAVNGEGNTLCISYGKDSLASHGCWFCHNQGIDRLRILRRKHPNLWGMLLKWDKDSPIPFKADGHTVHDFEKRFQLEDDGHILPEETFRWKMLEEPIQLRMML